MVCGGSAGFQCDSLIANASSRSTTQDCATERANMGGSDGEEKLPDPQETMLPTSAGEENSIMTDRADQEVDPAQTEENHCKPPTVTSMEIDDTILQFEDATWAALPTSDEQKRMAIEDVMVDVEEPILHGETTTGPPDLMIQGAQPSGSDNDNSPCRAENLLSSEETAAAHHVASNETVTSGVQNSTPAGEELGPNPPDIEGTPDHRKIHEGSRLANEKQWTETRPSDQPMVADTVKVKLEHHVVEAVLEPGEDPFVAESTSHSHETDMNTLGNTVPNDDRERGEIASKQPETPLSTQSSTKNVRFKEETPKPSRKPKLEAEASVKAEQSADVPWQDIAPKFEGSDRKPLPVNTQSMGPARTPREAVRREINRQLSMRRAKQEKKRQQKQTQKRKSVPSTEERGTKVSRMLGDDNAAAAAHLMPTSGRDLSRVHGFDGHDKGHDNDHETAENENEQACLHDHDEHVKDDIVDDDDEEAEEANVPDFDLKRAVTSANIRSPKTIQKIFGHGRATIHGADGLVITGMVSPLWKEQALAVYWMVNQEEIPVGPRGGVLAAGMGTGKTVMSLGIIAGNPPLAEDLGTYSHATLVVVPNQKLARQWMEKIAEHCTAAFTKESLVFDPKKGRMAQFLQMRNIVVTTYYEISKQKLKGAASQDLKQNWDNPKWRKTLPSAARTSPLFYVNWYRVILDEAHKISNKDTKTFKSCRALKAKYRWCLSGTPLANTDEEMLPYLNFLACDFVKSSTTFSEKFKAEQEQHRTGKEGSRPHMDALMSLVLYRYKLGNVVTLGEAKDIHVPLSVEETVIFDNVKPILNKQPTKLPRLRQTVSHIFNLDRMFCSDFFPAELDELIQELKTLKDRRSVFEVLEQRSEDPEAIHMYSAGLLKIQETSETRHINAYDFEPLLRKIKEEQELAMERCTRCGKKPRSWDWIKSYNCTHLFCSACLPPPPRPARDEQCPHLDCDAKLAFGSMVPSFANLATLAMCSNAPLAITDVNGSQAVRVDDERPALLLSSLGHISTPPSTKLVMAAAVILTWRKEHPGDKIVVFFEFLASAHILGSLLRNAGERFLYIFGSTGKTKTQLALNKFRSKDMSTPILIAGLRSAGEGLNLTEANRVITIDLWYNNAREDQAFARVHRIGQTKPTYFVRIVSQGDKLITAMQDRKAKEVSYAMKEDGHKVKRLGRNAFNAVFEEDPNPTDDDESEDEDEDQIGEDYHNDGKDDGKFARPVEKEAQELAELGSIPPVDSAEERGVEIHDLAVHGAEDCDMAGDDSDVQGVVQGTNGDEMSNFIDNGYGDQSQVLLSTGS